ncbi:cation transporter [Methanocella sp. CWC-04]|uniref:Cation transporter n=1 Tax=Methanooceanicella nereidis TaxID=2052831 RepID=A0AAP2RBT9_9EURY|nr:cation diffusion facilitator family transporter [Methanocella sp. CWC-04]MCD1293735.1 cation transporter [Methanocella sp. CWC-04]
MVNINSDIDALNKEKTSTARLSIISNTLLVFMKLTVGLMIGSVSVLSEAIHSGIDLVAAMIAYFSVRKSSMPPDREHAFGHGKIENLSGTIEAILIFVAAALIIKEAYTKITYGVEMEDVTLGIAVMLVSAIVNFFVSQKLMQTAKKTESIALEADAWHLRTDVLTSLGVFAGLVVIKLSGIAILDPVIAIIVALFILKAAFELTIKSVTDLLDTKLPAEEEEEIRKIISDHSSQFVGFHNLRTRKAGSDRFVDLHLVVSRGSSVEEAHGLADHIEKDVKERFPRASVLIHVEPCGERCKCEDCGAECVKKDLMKE